MLPGTLCHQRLGHRKHTFFTQVRLGNCHGVSHVSHTSTHQTCRTCHKYSCNVSLHWSSHVRRPFSNPLQKSPKGVTKKKIFLEELPKKLPKNTGSLLNRIFPAWFCLLVPLVPLLLAWFPRSPRWGRQWTWRPWAWTRLPPGERWGRRGSWAGGRRGRLSNRACLKTRIG